MLVKVWTGLTLVGNWISMVAGAILLVGIVVSFLAFFGAYPNVRSELKFDRPAMSAREALAQVAAVQVATNLGVSDPAVEFFLPSNVTLYVERSVLERIPYPEQSAGLARAAAPWCEAMKERWAPYVTLSDVRTGKRLASFNCDGGYSSWDGPTTLGAAIGGLFGLLLVVSLVGEVSGRIKARIAVANASIPIKTADQLAEEAKKDAALLKRIVIFLALLWLVIAIAVVVRLLASQ